MKSIDNKTAVVTGAASGIGRAIASKLADAGAHLYLLDIDEPALIAFADELRARGSHIVAWHCDLTDREALNSRIDDLLAETGGIDILVNNAGRAYFGATEAMSDEQWDLLLQVNLLAPAHIIRRFLPLMKERGDCHIVNICSIAGLIGFKRLSGYCLTKFGLVGFSESLRTEISKYGVGVTSVCPGFVRTPFFDSVMTRPGARKSARPLDVLCVSPEFIAHRTIRAIRRNKAMVVPGFFAQLLWLFKRATPGLLTFAFGGYRRRAKSQPCPEVASVVDGPHKMPRAAYRDGRNWQRTSPPSVRL